VIAFALAGGIATLAFLTSGNSDPSSPLTAGYTWSEIAVTLLGAGVLVAAIVHGARGRLWGAVTVGLFAAFTAFAALSIVWSSQPDWSWFGANQLLSYLAAFAGAAALARALPHRWPVLLGAVAIAMTALSAYALLAKVFPDTLAASNTYGRLLAPFGYWNAIGVAAAIGLPPCLWLGARRQGGLVTRAFAIPAVTVLISVVVLSYSRSALLVALLGAGLWIAFVPVRLRAALIAALGGLGAIPIVLWALGSYALTSDHVAPAAQDSAGHSFGLVLVVVLVLLTAVGFVTAVAMARVTVSAPLRRRIGTVLLGLVALIPVCAVVALAASSRGLTGEISHAWQSLTSFNSVVHDTSSRFSQLGSSRPLYWHQGLLVGEHALLKGVGELGYGIGRLRFTNALAKSDQAHSYLVQTFADLGLIGLAITLALLVAWGLGAARSLAGPTRWAELTPQQVSERQGLAAMAALVIAFGVQSALDWTWYFPGVAVPVLACAGWLAGRGPLTAPIGRARPATPLRRRPGAGALITAVVALALLASWLMWQPLHSANALTASENANTNAAAFADARDAASSDPLAIQPLDQLATLYQGINDNASARAELVRATQLQPANPEPWLWLGSLDMHTHQWQAAITALGHVALLDQPADVNRKTAIAQINLAAANLKAQRADVNRRSRARHRAAKRAAGRVAGRQRRR
jgi:hypothetical protein